MSKITLLCLLFSITFGCGSYANNRLIDALSETLQFTLENEKIIDINLLFGVAIVSGQLSIISQHNLNYALRFEINRLRLLCDNILKNTSSKNTTNISFEKSRKLLLSPEIWTFDHAPSYLSKWSKFYKFSRLKPEERSQSSDLLEFRREYEYCLQIFLEQCLFPVECFELVVKYRSKGYVITHQIIYLHTMRQMIEKNLCTSKSTAVVNDLNFIINEKCCQVYTEMQELERMLHGNKTKLDLLFEEVVVCGLQNYMEFLPARYLPLILDENVLRVDAPNTPESNFVISSAVHLMSVRAAATVLYLKRAIQIGW